MMRTATTALRLEPELKQRADALAAAEHSSFSAVVRDALNMYLSQLQFQPLGHAGALHQDLLASKRIGQGLHLLQSHQHGLERIESIGVVDGQHGAVTSVKVLI